MTTKCAKCSIVLKEGDPAVGCDYCEFWYHLACSKMSRALYGELTKTKDTDILKWRCPLCPPTQAPDRDFDKFKIELKHMFAELLDTKIAAIDESLKRQLELQKADIDRQITSVEKHVNTNSSEITSIRKELSSVQHQLNSLQIINNRHCINVFGIPQSTIKEYDSTVIKKIASYLNVPIDDKSMLYCNRLTKRKPNSVAGNNIPPIMVRFRSSGTAEDILNAYYGSKTSLKLSDVTDELAQSRVYISEFLTKHTLIIYRECCRLKHRGVIMKVFTRGGHVYASESADKSTSLMKVDSMEYLRKKYPNAYEQTADRTSNETSGNSELGASGAASLLWTAGQ